MKRKIENFRRHRKSFYMEQPGRLPCCCNALC